MEGAKATRRRQSERKTTAESIVAASNRTNRTQKVVEKQLHVLSPDGVQPMQGSRPQPPKK